MNRRSCVTSLGSKKSSREGIYTKMIYPDLLKLRNGGKNFGCSKKLNTMNTTSLNNRSSGIRTGAKSSLDLRSVQDQCVQSSPPTNNLSPTSFLASDKISEIMMKNDKGSKEIGVDTETCRHTEEKYVFKDEHSASGFPNPPEYSRSSKMLSRPKSSCGQTRIVEEILFPVDEYPDPGTAEFKKRISSSENAQLLKEKDEHIDLLRQLLVKSMKIIRSLKDQISILGAKPPTHPPLATDEKFLNILEEDVNEGSVEAIGQFLDALYYSTSLENEKMLHGKVDLLANKYGREARSLAEHLVKLTSRTTPFTPAAELAKKMRPSKETEMSLSPIHTISKSGLHTSVHNEILDLYKQAEAEMEANQMRRNAGLQMTFQQEELAQMRQSSQNESSLSSTSSVQNWKTFLAEERGTLLHNSRTVAKPRPDRSCFPQFLKEHSTNNKENMESNRLKRQKMLTEYKKPSKESSVLSDSIDANLINIESAMTQFLGGFKDIKKELTQMGNAMNCCSPTES